MTALPTTQIGTTGGAIKPPASEPLVAPSVNDGFQRQQQQEPQQQDLLGDDEYLRKASLDPRGSRKVAPYGTYAAVEQGLENGYYTGLEALDFGTLPDGTPAALFTDKNGQRQAIRLTPQQWFAAMQQRSQARIGMAQQMRKQRDADRLRGPVMAMAQELQSVAPGIDRFANIELEQDPQRAYATMQELYGRVKSRDETAVDELMKRVNGSNLQIARMQAQQYVDFETDKLKTQMEGVLNDQSVPDIMRAQMDQHLRQKILNIQQFGLFAPPDGSVVPSASFPSYYYTTGNSSAMTSLADSVIDSVGRDALEGMPEQLRIPVLVERAEDMTRRIGWGKAWSPVDRDIASRYIAKRLMGSWAPQEMSTQYATEEQLKQLSPNDPRRALVLGRQAQAARGTEELAQERAMAQAKLESERARAQAAMSGAERSAASTEQTRAITGIITEKDKKSYQDLKKEVLAIGYQMPDTGDPVSDILDAAKKLAADTSREGRARYARFLALLRKYQSK